MDAASHVGNLWKAVANADHQRGVHAGILPWQMFGNEARDISNANAINADALRALSNNHIASVSKPQVVVAQAAPPPAQRA